MPSTVSGRVTAFFLYDVAEAIDLPRVRQETGTGVAARLAPKPTTPPYVQYRQPPITVEGQTVGLPETDGFSVRFKVFEYGVLSAALTRALSGSWDAWLEHGLACHENAARLFGLATARLGLNQWKGSVQEKLKTLADIYRFAVEQTSMARGEVLELIVVLILVLELVLLLSGMMRL